jgi:hypothetical protein
MRQIANAHYMDIRGFLTPVYLRNCTEYNQ